MKTRRAKHWWESRTIWFNGITLLVAVATVLAAPEHALPPLVVQIAGIVVAVGNIVLRFSTDRPIGREEL